MIREFLGFVDVDCANLKVYLNSFDLVFVLKGSLEDEGSLEEAVSKVDVVISAIPSKHVLDQKLLIKVIKQAASIKVSSYLNHLILISVLFFDTWLITFAEVCSS